MESATLEFYTLWKEDTQYKQYKKTDQNKVKEDHFIRGPINFIFYHVHENEKGRYHQCETKELPCILYGQGPVPPGIREFQPNEH